jgi:hypothetical protein
MQRHVSREQALKNAFASARMEGYIITSDTERNCKRLLDGKINADQLVAEIKKKSGDRKQAR